MKKRILAMCLASASILAAFSGCNSNNTSSTTSDNKDSSTDASKPTDSSATDDNSEAETPTLSAGGKVVNIQAWNEEFKGFFEQYFTGTAPIGKDDDGNDIFYENPAGKKYVDAGIEFKWTITPSEDSAYQNKLDTLLQAQSSAAADDKVDFFLAEADYIYKYVNSDYTKDISQIGVKELDTMYKYTVQACTSDDGKTKGVSFQCCPSGMIYRRSIAKEVLGTDDPAEVQAMVSDWTKFDEVAAKMKDKGYTMTASFAETYRAFSNNASSAWVKDGKWEMPAIINDWMTQADKYVENGYTLTAGIWDKEKTDTMFKDGKNFCNFGPAWYFNFCMNNAWGKDADGNYDESLADKATIGDWALIEGPMAHFWGGTWILAAEGGDNEDIVADVMKAFTENEEICTNLVKINSQFSNNTKANEKLANDADYGNELLGGQNDVKVFCELAKNIKWENATAYDQPCNEKLQSYLQEHYKTPADITKDKALANYKQFLKDTFPELTVE